MNKKEYLEKKGLVPVDFGTMYIVHSTRVGVTLKEIKITNISNRTQTSYSKENGAVKRNYVIYDFDEGPHSLIIEEGESFGQDDGYASGWGDLWCWSYFGTLDKAVADKILEEETLRVMSKYHLTF